MPRHELSQEAQADVVEIYAYIALDNVYAADAFVEELEELCEKIAEFPKIGRARLDLGLDIRSLPFGNYHVLYRRQPSGTLIVRVLSGFRDLPSLFD